MRSVKKITKEDTWRSDDLKVHIQAHNEESRRRSKRVEEHRKHRDGESEDRRHRDPDRDPRREKEKRREREGSKHRDPERDRNQDIKREDVREDRHKERRREREKARHGDGDEDEKRYNRDDKENGERRRDREKDRNVDMYNQEDKERERDRRRAERARRKEERGEGEKEERERDKERERERRERHRARESDRYRLEYDEKQREGERRERHSDKEHSGHKEREHRRDREDKERRRRDKESHMAKTSHSREAEHHRQELKDSKDFHGIKDGESEKAREERERRHERKHKEASDSKRSDREQKQDLSGHDLNARISRDKEETTKRPQLTWRSDQAETSDPEVSVENEETEQDKESSKDDRNHYEEDFEDYEEDFEDVDEDEDDKAEEDEKEEHENKAREDKRELSPRRRQEIEAIQRAMDEENERIYSARSKPSTADSTVTQRDRLSNANQTRGTIIDFVSAKQREISQKVARKQKKRSEELLRLIDLDFSITFSMLDLPPVNEYDMYIKNFGTANTKQAYVQCNEDSTDRDIQTEDVEMTDKWTQHPPEAKSACGGSTGTQANAVESIARTSTDSKRLTTFLRSAAQVMAVLVEENMAQSNSVKKLCSKTDALSFSDGCIQLNTKLPFLNGRQVSLLQFSQVQRQTLLSVHPPSSKNSSVRLDSETVVCVWNIWEPSRPQKILLYESEVKCCCFSPGKVTLVFAGTAVGSVIVWDLREHSGSHSNLEIGKEVWTLRYPTFSTDAVLSGVGHLSPVVSIEPVIASADMSSTSTLTADIEECMGLSFQLGSLDENGVLTLWVVIELPKGNDSGSQTDLGLRPGGKVKLLHSSSLQTTERLPKDTIMGFGPSVSLQLKFLPSDSNHYFIGTNMGLVRHGTRHSLKVLPKVYRSQSDSYRPVEVTALDFSPLGEPFFLIGCSDGSVRLHSVLREDPLMEWAGRSSGAPILSVQWSQTRPAVFCVLDAASDLHIWDLTEKDYVPVITENIHSDRVTAMAVFGEPAKQNTFSGIALAKQSGKVEIQYFKKSLTVSSASDKEKIDSILHDAFLTRDMR
ncbi:cytoplasmic dynein 2 intermediate chain 1 isoform X3 [Danio rerio]|uniref:Cytoplasmic dynein 2 intermediate chain 1 isoform X3 n=1 Tax=Danio rerio TaxID=7955 RepID=A0A8M1RKA7_DANRE|nr:WD repeat-containing protein 60 isoform X1 [Danio rerio]|eukprot:XP_002662902.2 WD repeat-containing protein 60 isoform X1 [Danio rerio]